mgnify:CR=1 FL=1
MQCDLNLRMIHLDASHYCNYENNSGQQCARKAKRQNKSDFIMKKFDFILLQLHTISHFLDIRL